MTHQDLAKKCEKKHEVEQTLLEIQVVDGATKPMVLTFQEKMCTYNCNGFNRECHRYKPMGYVADSGRLK